MSDKAQLSPSRGFRWNVVQDNNRRELWQVSVSFIVHISKALFPSHPEVLKATCFRGYKDGISFLKSRSTYLRTFVFTAKS